MRTYNLSFPSPWGIDILGKLDFDFVFIDGEHGPFGPVPDIDLHSIGPNDLAQSLGYPGQPDHPEVVKTMQEITRRIRQAGRTMQPDVMQGTWVSDMLLGGVSPATLHRYKNREYPSVADFG